MKDRDNFIELMYGTNFQKGSISHLNILAKEYFKDILKVTKGYDKDGFALVKIIVKSNYNMNEVLRFTKDCLPVGIDYEIIVKSETEEI